MNMAADIVVLNKESDIGDRKLSTESVTIESSWSKKGDYWVADVGFQSETVCNGALKTWEEILKTKDLWEGRPFTLDHPDSSVITRPRDILGFLREITEDEEHKRLLGKVYLMAKPSEFNDQKLSYWKLMIEAIKDRPEISVGYYAEFVDSSGKFEDAYGNIIEYDWESRNILPDHIASVEKGACSPGQGCGFESDVSTAIFNEVDSEDELMEDKEDKESRMKKLYSILHEFFTRKDADEHDAPAENPPMAENVVFHPGDDEADNTECDCVPDPNPEPSSVNNMKENEIIEEEMDQDEDEHVPGSESAPCNHEKLLAEKDVLISELETKLSSLKEIVGKFEADERERLIREASELTTLSEERMSKLEVESLKVLIEGARSSKLVETEEEENGVNLQSGPNSSEDDVFVEDLYVHPLDR